MGVLRGFQQLRCSTVPFESQQSRCIRLPALEAASTVPGLTETEDSSGKTTTQTKKLPTYALVNYARHEGRQARLRWRPAFTISSQDARLRFRYISLHFSSEFGL